MGLSSSFISTGLTIYLLMIPVIFSVLNIFSFLDIDFSSYKDFRFIMFYAYSSSADFSSSDILDDIIYFLSFFLGFNLIDEFISGDIIEFVWLFSAFFPFAGISNC